MSEHHGNSNDAMSLTESSFVVFFFSDVVNEKLGKHTHLSFEEVSLKDEKKCKLFFRHVLSDLYLNI